MSEEPVKLNERVEGKEEDKESFKGHTSPILTIPAQNSVQNKRGVLSKTELAKLMRGEML